MSDIEAGRSARVGRLVLFDPAAGALAQCEDNWVVPSLGDIAKLLAEAEAEAEAEGLDPAEAVRIENSRPKGSCIR